MARQDEYDDDRVVIVRRDGGGVGAGMLLLGLAIGAGAALLFAPSSGAETRDRLQREARRAGRRARHLTDQVSDTLAYGVERTRSRFDKEVDRARDAVSSRGRAMGEAVTAAREAALDARADLERAVATSKRAYADSRRAYREARAADARRHHHDDAQLIDPSSDHGQDTADGAAHAG